MKDYWNKLHHGGTMWASFVISVSSCACVWRQTGHRAQWEPKQEKAGRSIILHVGQTSDTNNVMTAGISRPYCIDPKRAVICLCNEWTYRWIQINFVIIRLCLRFYSHAAFRHFWNMIVKKFRLKQMAIKKNLLQTILIISHRLIPSKWGLFSIIMSELWTVGLAKYI